MEEWIRVIAPVIAPLAAIAALWWKLTTSMATKKDISELRADMYRLDDKLRADMSNLEGRLRADMSNLEDRLRADMSNLEDRLFAEISKLNDRMDRLDDRMDRLDDRMDRLDDRMDRLDDRMDKFNDRMDGLYDAHHKDIMKVLEKMDGVANDLRAEIRERIHGKADSDEN